MLSPPVTMEPLGAPTTPRLPDRLLACAVYVRVSDVRAGSWVSVHSMQRGGDPDGLMASILGGEIGRAQAEASDVSVDVSGGPLIEGDTVWACTTGCQDKSSRSAPVAVESARGLLRPVVLVPVYPIDRAVQVVNLEVGARVIARVVGPKHLGGQKIWTSYAWAPEVPVFVGDLFEGDEVTVFQALCHTNATENQSDTVTVILGDMGVSIAPQSIIHGVTTGVSVQATDPARGNAMVSGDVLIDGVKVGPTNAVSGWRAPASGTSATVQVNAPGYKPWSGSIALRRYSPPPTPQVPPISVPGKPASTKHASYRYTCEPQIGGVTFKVTGEGFPAGSYVTIEPHFDGVFTAFGRTHICGQDTPATSRGPFGPYTVDATGKFEATNVTVLYGCQPECSVQLVASCDKLLRTQILHPGGPSCKCKTA